MGFLSYTGMYFTYAGLIRSSFLIDVLSLTIIYFFGKKIGSFYFLIGTATGFLYINKVTVLLTPFFPILASSEYVKSLSFRFTIFSDMLFFFFYSLNYKSIIDSWSTKKIFRYFTRNAFIIPTYYIVYLVLLSMTNENMGHHIRLDSVSQLEVLLQMATIGLKSMFVNIHLFVCSSFSTVFLALFTLSSPMDPKFSKLDSRNVVFSKGNKILFLMLVTLTGIFYYYHYTFLTMIFMTYSVSLMFLFFLIGREILFKSLDKITGGNIILTIIILSLVTTLIPKFLYVMITIGFIEAYLNIWNPNRNQSLE